MATIADVPSYDMYMWPILERLKAHGGSMTNEEMLDDVSSSMGLSDEVRSVLHGKTSMTAVDYRMAWARTYLKKAGALENSARGVWRLTPKGAEMTKEQVVRVPKLVQQEYMISKAAQVAAPDADPALPAMEGSWSDQLLQRLLQLHPAAFERLCQRLLREAGFTRVEVTGRSGDGGIDGAGVLRVNLLSFQVIFQCKRWQGSVSSPVVRDFRGAMVGRADKGLIITTGSFTAEARKEATRDGAPAIDLIDGEALCELLKELKIGVKVEMVPQVTIDEEALASL
jgi:restriction system protein